MLEGDSPEAAAKSQDAVDPIVWPSDGQVSVAWIEKLREALVHATWKRKPDELPQIFPPQVFEALIDRATKLMQSEQNVVDVSPKNGETVTVVGDVHGQFHDVLRLLERAGQPSEKSLFVFNGDYVDRGAWSVETYALLLAWKVCLPKHVILIRGNHETKYCAHVYGFKQELEAKYGAHSSRGLFKKLLVCFTAHPLAAVVGFSTFIAHGGLFRELPSWYGGRKGKKGGKNRKGGRDNHKRAKHGSDAPEGLKVGSIAELRKVKRAVLDPLDGRNPLPSDVLWSDPGLDPGIVTNDSRGIGLVFGPDCTQTFLESHRLKLVIRSHEGPDAREKREGMHAMLSGFCEDHVVPAGKLVTLFSAPDYPQFQNVDDVERYKNTAAYVVLSGPGYDTPEVHHFDAALPRPEVKAYYDFETALDSDEDLDLGSEADGSEASLFSDGSDVDS
ncbi:protein phosphatase 5 [Klebsormidium nitens]|uniref:Serine/threonine-protein phosphatase n=1 Tax=Klebsormidium nitens TaxID=105231 RepID=A0A1Y1IP87_KLENI|nr:protein phosphatase 5 [Klebsormidium nitens]|eukprot:GAQ91309.1 protein phosphatase 5 [Klebsormidium nitens]